jgi:hypothetical protein
MESYKGLYFNNKKEEKTKFFEGGAHFKYIDLYKKLDSLSKQLNVKNKINSEEQKLFDKKIKNLIPENQSRNIKSIIISLSQRNNKKKLFTSRNHNSIINKSYQSSNDSKNNSINNINIIKTRNKIKSQQIEKKKINNSILNKISNLNYSYIIQSKSRNKNEKKSKSNSLNEIKTILSKRKINIINVKSRNINKYNHSNSSCIKFNKKDNSNEIGNLKEMFILKKAPSLYTKISINPKFNFFNLNNFYTKNKSIKPIIFDKNNSNSNIFDNNSNSNLLNDNFHINFNLKQNKKIKHNILNINGTIAQTNKYF